ncbi:hypothetical protein [Streptomyces qinglanensis]|uniref:hypothetical protein n=1 Tax=Streptomyces qinglanensis TaxID=943816 RepID=UPI0013A6DC20|nr:hypothetical protein [Streptomyces qinglanensis]
MALPTVARPLLAAVVLPGDGADLTMTRLLIGCGAMASVQVGGGFVGGLLSRAHSDKEN